MTELHLDFRPSAARVNFGSTQRVPTGATDYDELQNLPSINGEELIGNKTAAELGLATPEDIPTDNAELQNGAGYQTAQQVGEAVATAVEPLSDAVSAIEGKIPAAASSSNQLMDAASVNAAIAEALSGITGIAFEVVQSLPVSGEAGTIYLVPHGGSEATDIYDEYVWLASSRWELLGTTAVDLTGYATEEWVRQQGYGTYTKPASGIPSADLAPAVNTALDMARLSLQPGALAPYRTAAEQDLIDAGKVSDVQVNGTSIVQDGVAKLLPATPYQLGVTKALSDYGILVLQSGDLTILAASQAEAKAGSHSYRPIVPSKQHAAAFYGLAKAAGDTTQSQSANAIGQYTPAAKSAVAEMLGGAVSVTGTTPTITALPGVRYVCGECATLDITPPASGIVDVVFTSGTTPTVLTLPAAVKMPDWFDSTALEADTIYEINIMDGFGTVMAWPI